MSFRTALPKAGAQPQAERQKAFKPSFVLNATGTTSAHPEVFQLADFEITQLPNSPCPSALTPQLPPLHDNRVCRPYTELTA